MAKIRPTVLDLSSLEASPSGDSREKKTSINKYMYIILYIILYYIILYYIILHYNYIYISHVYIYILYPLVMTIYPLVMTIYPLVVTNSLPWKITMLLRTINHLFLWALFGEGLTSGINSGSLWA